VEILVVLSILAALAGVIIVATSKVRGTARTRRTEALLDRLSTAIGEYQRMTGELPPDGMDSKVEVDGERLPSSATLYKALAEPIVDKYFVAGEYKIREIPPIMIFEAGDFEADDELEGVYHLIDGFGQRIHYDNLTRKRNPPDLEDQDATLDDSDDYGRRKSRLGYELWSLGMRANKVDDEEES